MPSPGGGRRSRVRRRDADQLDAGVRIDLGGIGKGYAAERAAEILATAGPCLVNAGGDIAVRGGHWPIGVETAEEPLTLELSAADWPRPAATGAAGSAAAASSTT